MRRALAIAGLLTFSQAAWAADDDWTKKLSLDPQEAVQKGFDGWGAFLKSKGYSQNEIDLLKNDLADRFRIRSQKQWEANADELLPTQIRSFLLTRLYNRLRAANNKIQPTDEVSYYYCTTPEAVALFSVKTKIIASDLSQPRTSTNG